jgi:uncharacterized membrane protein
VNLGFVILGALAALVGIGLLVAGIRGGAGENPRATAKLIGGMMLTAFGLVLAGFAIGYSTTAPLNYAGDAQ